MKGLRLASIILFVVALLAGCGITTPTEVEIGPRSVCTGPTNFGEPDIKAVAEAGGEQWLWFGNPQEGELDRVVEFDADCQITRDEYAPAVAWESEFLPCRTAMAHHLREHGEPPHAAYWYDAPYGHQQIWDYPNLENPIRTVYQWGPGVENGCFTSSTYGIDWWD